MAFGGDGAAIHAATVLGALRKIIASAERAGIRILSLSVEISASVNEVQRTARTAAHPPHRKICPI